MPSLLVTDIVRGAAKFYIAPYGEAIPADSVGFGEAWGGNWVGLGLTQEPLTLGAELETTPISAQEALLSIDEFISGGNMFVETVLSQLSGDILQYVMGGGGTKTDTAAGAGTYGKTEFVFGGEDHLVKYTVGVESKQNDDDGTQWPVRFFLWRCTIRGNGDMEFAKDRENGTGLPIHIQVHEDLTQTQGQRWFKYQNITADPTS